MRYDPITPFQRDFNPCAMDTQGALPPRGVDKYEALREVGVARRRLGMTDREVTVLQALLSFYPGRILGGNSVDLIVFPSNAAICERLNGMALSTMRRHLAGLVRSGLIARRDSPNGKRFSRKYRDDSEAFGFDLTPLAVRFPEVCALAEEERAEQEAFERARRTVSLMRRDLAALAAYGAEHSPAPVWDQFDDLATLTARRLRRKLSMSELDEIRAQLEPALDAARRVFDPNTEDMSTNDAQSKQHYHNSNKDLLDSEPCLEKQRASGANDPDAGADCAETDPVPYEKAKRPTLPLPIVTKALVEAHTYCDGPMRHWHHVVATAEIVRPMMGVSPSAWHDAVQAMGPEDASVILLAMLERIEAISSPGGYLRALARKAENGGFSCAPMVMALLNRAA